MKKTLLAAAILSSVSAGAFAQTNVTVYGNLDLGVAFVSGAKASTHTPTTAIPAFNGGNETKLRDGIQAGSRLGFRGTEDLGGGLAGLFVLEAGILADTGASDQGGLLFGRQAYVGLKSNAGTLTLGRQIPVHYLALKAIDPMDDGFAGPMGLLIPTNGKRVNNAIKYATPTVNGLSGDLFYALGEVAGNSDASRTLGASGTYAAGKLMLKLAYHSLNNATASDDSNNTMFGGTYNFGAVKAHAAYNVNKGTGTLDNADLLLGVSVPMGQHKFMLSTIMKDDKTVADRDATLVSLAYTYALSKRTGLYASYADMNNDNGATYRTSSATAPISGQSGAAGGTREFNVGVRHQF